MRARSVTLYQEDGEKQQTHFTQWLVSHSSESPSSVFPPFKETTALPSCQNSTRSKPAGHANPPSSAALSPERSEEVNPRTASSRGQSRRSRLSMASPNLTTLQACAHVHRRARYRWVSGSEYVVDIVTFHLKVRSRYHSPPDLLKQTTTFVERTDSNLIGRSRMAPLSADGLSRGQGSILFERRKEQHATILENLIKIPQRPHPWIHRPKRSEDIKAKIHGQQRMPLSSDMI